MQLLEGHSVFAKSLVSTCRGWLTGPNGPTRTLCSARLWKSACFLALSFPLGAFWFLVPTVLILVAFGTDFVWVGLAVLPATMWLWIAGARVERWRVATLLGQVLPSPYRPLPAGSPPWAIVRDVAAWKDLVYVLLLSPLGFIETTIVVVALIMPVCLIEAALYFLALGRHMHEFVSRFASNAPEALAAALIGLLWLLAGQYLVLGAARVHAALARALLGPGKQAHLEARVAALTESRSRVLDVTMLDRQRIERDLHDGAQQRLVALAMNLGMAREKLATDPAAAQALVAEAHEEAKRALAEIRDLIRGIYPAVLADRGLDAAISALAGRCSVPVTVNVELSERLPMALESTAYFIIAEALTNVARHSRASVAWVTVRREREALLVEVGDNGVGGADAARGTGLAGLADRVAAYDGQFAILSPAGGPTCIKVELPCGS